MPSINPLLLSLLLLIGLLVVLSNLLSNKLSERSLSSNSVYLVFFLAVICAALLTLAGWLLSSPQQNVAVYYWVLGIGFACSLLASIFLLKSPPETASSTPIETTLKHNIQTRHKLLDDVKKEAEGRLESSLNHAVLINLLKERLEEQVECKWAAEVKIGNQPRSPLAFETQIVQVFDLQAIAGKLLILGAPGAGKTTTLLEIALTLCDRAFDNPNEPIPVLFNLSTWNERLSIADWLVTSLNEHHGVRVDIGRFWVENRQLLPLLDGLDELESHRQEKCVQAINYFLGQTYSPKHLVICSRQDEYQLYNTKIQLNGAVYLQPLTYAQIHDYLIDVGQPQLWQNIKHEPELLKLVKTPLLLTIMALAFEGIPLPELQQRHSPQASRQYLFDTYVERMLRRKIKRQWYPQGKEPTPEQSKHWLSWLANKLKAELKDEFLLEKMQSTWLPPAQKKLYRLSIGLIGGLTVGLTGGLIFNLASSSPLDKLIFCLTSGTFSGLVFGLRPNIQPIETIRWSRSKAQKGLLFGLFTGLTYGLLTSVPFTVLHTPNSALSVEVTSVILTVSRVSLMYCLFGGLIGVLLGGLSGPDIEKRTAPNQGIRRSAANTITFALAGWFIFGIIAVLARWRFLGVSPDAYTFISSGLIGGLIGAIVPGIACLQHFILRFMLWRNGYIPWNYARFLNYATERLFLQKVGGRYRFIHDLLREHFAQLL